MGQLTYLVVITLLNLCLAANDVKFFAYYWQKVPVALSLAEGQRAGWITGAWGMRGSLQEPMADRCLQKPHCTCVTIRGKKGVGGWVLCVCLSCTFWPVLKKKTLHSVFTVTDVWWMSLSAVARKPKHWPGLSASHPDGPGLSCHGGPRASGRSEGPQKFIHPIDFHSPQWWIGSLTGSLSRPRDSSGLRVGAGGAQVTGNPAQIVLKLLF